MVSAKKRLSARDRKRTPFQRALVALGACPWGMRQVGRKSLRAWWAWSLKHEPDDCREYRCWLLEACDAWAPELPVQHRPGTHPGTGYEHDVCPPMKTVVAAAKARQRWLAQ